MRARPQGTTLPATSQRPNWCDLPAPVRAAIENRLGGPVTLAVSHGATAPGFAARLTLADGCRAFVKAAPADGDRARVLRSQASTALALPAETPTPWMRFNAEVHGWIVLAFDDVDGRHLDTERPGDLRAATEAVESLAEVLTPNPIPDAVPAAKALAPLLHGWRSLATASVRVDLDPWSRRNLDRLAELERRWARAVTGTTLLHADLRPDHVLIGDDGRAQVVDWAGACVGAPWVDLVILLCSTAGSAASIASAAGSATAAGSASAAGSAAAVGSDPEAIVRHHPLTRYVDAADIDALVCALAGRWTYAGQGRADARRARAARTWLARRTGWR